MIRTKAVVARTPEALARTLGLSGSESHEWQVQHALLKKLRQIGTSLWHFSQDAARHAQ